MPQLRIEGHQDAESRKRLRQQIQAVVRHAMDAGKLKGKANARYDVAAIVANAAILTLYAMLTDHEAVATETAELLILD